MGRVGVAPDSAGMYVCVCVHHSCCEGTDSGSHSRNAPTQGMHAYTDVSSGDSSTAWGVCDAQLPSRHTHSRTSGTVSKCAACGSRGAPSLTDGVGEQHIDAARQRGHQHACPHTDAHRLAAIRQLHLPLLEGSQLAGLRTTAHHSKHGDGRSGLGKDCLPAQPVSGA